MDRTNAIDALSALAQEHRLDVFRRLVRAGGDGMAAGALARAAGVAHNTMSSHLAALSRAGLIRCERSGRSHIYRIDMAAVRDLFTYLLRDCCRGRPEDCADLLETLLPDCAGGSGPRPRRETEPAA